MLIEDVPIEDFIYGFSHILSLASYGVVSVEVFEIPDLPLDENLFFALAVDPPSEDTVYSRILRGKTLGKHWWIGIPKGTEQHAMECSG